MTTEVKVMFSLPREFLTEVDRLAREEHRNRSELLFEAMRLYIENRRGEKFTDDNSRVRSAIAVQDALSRLAPGTGEDSTVDLRHWRNSR